MTNLYGWYLIPVIALLALHPDRLSRIYVVIASTLGLAYYPMFIYGHYNSGWTRFRIHQFLALFLTAPIVLYLAARLVTWRLPLARRNTSSAKTVTPTVTADPAGGLS
jgi:hypothetical protein